MSDSWESFNLYGDFCLQEDNKYAIPCEVKWSKN